MVSQDGGRARRVDGLGLPFDPITLRDALSSIDDWITAGAHEYVCLAGMRALSESQANERLRSIYDGAALVIVDAMSIVWLNRLLNRRWTERIRAVDLLLACCERSVTAGYRHFFLGGRPGAAVRLADQLARRVPGLSVAGCLPTPDHITSADEDRRLVQEINGTAADIVWVGLASPAQEYWIAEHMRDLTAAVVIGLEAFRDVAQAERHPNARGLSHWFVRRRRQYQQMWRTCLVTGRLLLNAAERQMWRDPSGVKGPTPRRAADWAASSRLESASPSPEAP